jgi:hypothetical protein
VILPKGRKASSKHSLFLFLLMASLIVRAKSMGGQIVTRCTVRGTHTSAIVKLRFTRSCADKESQAETLVFVAIDNDLALGYLLL